MNERTAEATTTVEEDGIRVEKSFTDDAFPVPAVMYELSSAREDAVRVRIVDRIPESFPMDRVGFHPDYESENWTAYKDHRVEFERVLEPGESVETVFGIRDDDPDLEAFLGAPVIEHVPVGEEIEDVLGTDETDAVREVLSGDRETLPGMEDLSEAESTPAEFEESETEAELKREDPATEDSTATDPTPEDEGSQVPDPRDLVETTTSAVTRHDEVPEPSDESPDADDSHPEDVPGEVDESDSTESEPSDSDEPDPTPKVAPEGIASALADEIRSGEVDEADLNLLRSELDVGVPRSVDVRISRLQSSVADIEAYADALAEFIDEEGTAREILDGIDARVDDVEDEVGALDGRVTAGERAHGELATEVVGIGESVDDIEESVDDVESTVETVESDISGLETDMSDVEGTVGELRESVSAVEGDVHEVKETVGGVVEDIAGVEADVSTLGDDVDDLDDDIETLYEGVDDAAAAAERTDDRVDDVEDRMGRFDEEFDDLWDDLAEVDTRLTEIEDRLGDDLEDVDAELAAINDHLEELEAFRERLNEAFGP